MCPRGGVALPWIPLATLADTKQQQPGWDLAATVQIQAIAHFIIISTPSKILLPEQASST